MTMLTSRIFLVPFLSVLFFVFYVVAWSVLMGIRENYLRYAQKSELQWTGPGQRKTTRPLPIFWFLLASVVTSIAVVEGVIL